MESQNLSYNDVEGIRHGEPEVSDGLSSSASCLDTLKPNELALFGDDILDSSIILGDKIKNQEGLPYHYKVKESIDRAGGAGLVHLALQELGHEVNYQLGYVPEIKVRVYKDKEMLFRYDKGFPKEEVILPFEPIKHINGCRYIAIVDYNKGGVPENLVKEIKEKAFPEQVFVHTKNTESAKLKYYSEINPIFFTNSREWPVNHRYPGIVVQTLGAQGARLLIDGNELKRVKSKAKEVNTVVGAGDYVMAGFIDGYIRGLSYSESLEWAMIVVAEAMKAPYTCKIEEGKLDIRWYYGK